MRFLTLLDMHFPTQHKLCKIFTRNTVNDSYTCTKNMSSFILSHYKKVLKLSTKNVQLCNCRNKNECLLDEKCLILEVIYNCVTSTSINLHKPYLGTVERDFKKQYNNHTKSFRRKLDVNDTTLLQYILETKK